ncbi:MAG: C13 family peptidase [Pseudomonadota bacterium]
MADNVRLPDGGRYDGELRKGVLHGTGVLTWPSGDRYEGEFRRGRMHGEGVLSLANGDRYQGQLREGQPHGRGVFEFSDGSRYEGEMALGYPGGKGKMTWVTGDWYEGEFELGYPSGKGFRYYSDGTEYEGEFVSGAENGQGEMRMPSGHTFSGLFENREIRRGRWQWGPDAYYEGGFENWVSAGDGVMVNEMGRFSGRFEEGFLYQGVHELPDGGRYEGGFDGYFSYQGKGRLTASDGTVLEGEFSEGEYLGPSKSWADKATDAAKAAVAALTPGPTFDPPAPAELLAEKSLYLQPELLADALAAIPPEQPEQIDLYVVQVAGDGREEVFRREVEFAAGLQGSLWDNAARVITLANSRTSVERLPMATRASLRQTLDAVAEKMNREQDILLVYLTSHGSEDHQLSLAQNGMRLPDLPAPELGEMLAGLEVKHKVVIVAACFSGGFIPYLDDGQTLVMTSARRDRTSFGCADENEMTDFGRAFLAEALAETDSLVAAFELARTKVSAWEEERELTPSEPQLLRSETVEQQLSAWRSQRDER